MKRATVLLFFLPAFFFNFNPRPREEGDIANDWAEGVLNDFNPRPREEGDSSIIVAGISLIDFNPRPREEGDA